MQYTIKKEISGIKIVPDGENFKAIVDYTIIGIANHNGINIPINNGISVEVPIPKELVFLSDSIAETQISQTYIND